jgi:hypothetical protein
MEEAAAGDERDQIWVGSGGSGNEAMSNVTTIGLISPKQSSTLHLSSLPLSPSAA